MVCSLRALLAGIIDYAGLFPPARLPLGRAIEAYARYRRGSDDWMLSRFVCPAERLGELAPLVPKFFSPEFPLRIAALGRGGKDTAEFLAGLRADGEAIGAFRERYREQTEVAVYEVRLPRDVLVAGSEQAAGNLLREIAQTLEQTSLASLTAYYEPAPGEAWRPSVAVVKEALAKNNRQRAGAEDSHEGTAGLKLRCGGLEAGDFPSPEQVASAITACRDAGVPLKFTAGLHHPLRRFDTGVQTIMHGFLNIFVAGVLAHARQLGEDQVRRILEDQAAEDFAFDDEGLRWNDYRATVAEIEAARRFVASFGSCSFEEPGEDLRTMGLLP